MTLPHLPTTITVLRQAIITDHLQQPLFTTTSIAGPCVRSTITIGTQLSNVACEIASSTTLPFSFTTHCGCQQWQLQLTTVIVGPPSSSINSTGRPPPSTTCSRRPDVTDHQH
ncbi:unnamed protein product [Lactuca virosa]|uniref:Uncharacterized protein n=1 Tax=Lactuca virosa TaxID=75947 RepID=A0AAU9P180_9ASTR|nr:unnamed protein product [Lactuca virosa]